MQKKRHFSPDATSKETQWPTFSPVIILVFHTQVYKLKRDMTRNNSPNTWRRFADTATATVVKSTTGRYSGASGTRYAAIAFRTSDERFSSVEAFSRRVTETAIASLCDGR